MMHVRYLKGGTATWCGGLKDRRETIGPGAALRDLNAPHGGRMFRLCPECVEAMRKVLGAEPRKPKPAFSELLEKVAELETPSVMAVPAAGSDDVDLAEQVGDFDPDDSAACPVCERCGDSYRLREGEDPTVFCDMCAQAAIKELAREVRGLRTELTEERARVRPVVRAAEQLARVVRDAHRWPDPDVPLITGSETVRDLCEVVAEYQGKNS